MENMKVVTRGKRGDTNWAVQPQLTSYLLKLLLQILKINVLQELYFCFVSNKSTSIPLQRYVVLSMLLSYSSCNVHLIMKRFIDLTFIRVVPCTTLDPAVRYSDDVNI